MCKLLSKKQSSKHFDSKSTSYSYDLYVLKSEAPATNAKLSWDVVGLGYKIQQPHLRVDLWRSLQIISISNIYLVRFLRCGKIIQELGQ